MNEAIVFPLLSGLFIVLGYVGYFVIYGRYKAARQEELFKQRISEVSLSPKLEIKEDLSLIKEQAIQDTFLQSKLPKVEGLKHWIEHAGITISPTLFVLISGAVGIFVTFVFSIILHAPILLALLLGGFACFTLPWAFISILTAKRKNVFLAEFPVALDIMRRALRAGFSTDRAIEMVAEQQAGQVGKIFRTISEKMRLGESVEVVLADMANRVGIDEFRMLAIVLVLQRETGGSLAEATENFAKIVRARQSIRKKIKALTAEVRVTAIILMSLPFFILGAVLFTSPSYLDTLFYTEKGQLLLIVGGLMLVTGMGIILRMTYKEIY